MRECHKGSESLGRGADFIGKLEFISYPWSEEDQPLSLTEKHYINNLVGCNMEWRLPSYESGQNSDGEQMQESYEENITRNIYALNQQLSAPLYINRGDLAYNHAMQVRESRKGEDTRSVGTQCSGKIPMLVSYREKWCQVEPADVLLTGGGNRVVSCNTQTDPKTRSHTETVTGVGTDGQATVILRERTGIVHPCLYCHREYRYAAGLSRHCRNNHRGGNVVADLCSKCGHSHVRKESGKSQADPPIIPRRKRDEEDGVLKQVKPRINKGEYWIAESETEHAVKKEKEMED